MSEEFKVSWEVDSGCDGPHSFFVDLDKLSDSCKTENQVDLYLAELLEDSFREQVTTCITNFDEVIAAWRHRKEKIL